MLQDVFDESQTVELRVCDGQLVGERLSDVEDRARLVRGVDGLRASVGLMEHAADQTVDRLGIGLEGSRVETGRELG